MLRRSVVLLFVLLTASVCARAATGSLAGTVTDPSAAAIVNAKVSARNIATGQTFEQTTDATGSWRLSLLPPGTYEVAFAAQGFKRTVRSGVNVEAAVVRNVDETLTVGAAQDEIAVTEDAILVDTHDATNFRQFNSLELQQVPSGTRNFTHLLSAEAGISNDLPPVAVNDNGAISPSVSGQRRTSNSLTFNGTDVTNLLTSEGSLTETVSPAPETLQEVKVQTSLYDASTGRSGGGNFQLITQGGGNQFHGSGYFFAQNEAFASNDFFFERDGIEKPNARRYEWGGTFGGPIKKDKAFFFVGYQRTDAETAFVPTGSAQASLPLALNLITGDRTADALAAAFNAANTGGVVLTVNSGNPFTDISPIAVALFNARNPATGDYLIPAPATFGGTTQDGIDQAPTLVGGVLYGGNPFARIRQAMPAVFDQDQINSRFDWAITGTNRLYSTYYFSNFPSLDPFPDPSSLVSPFTQKRANRAHAFSVADVQNFGSKWVNEARFGFLLLNNTRGLDDPFLSSDFESAAFGIGNPALIYDNSFATRRLGHFVARNFSWSFGGPNDSFNKRDQRTLHFADNVIYSSGRHTLRFGGELKRHRVANNLPEEQATEFEKFNNWTQLLRGLASEADTQFGITDKTFTSTDIGWFAAYDIKLRPSLTLNLGVRWDWFGWPIETNGQIGNFDPAIADTENPLNGFLVPDNVQPTGFAQLDDAVAATARAGNNHTMNGQDLNNFQPRIGFAWQPFGKGNFVIRGGYGFFYDRPSAAYINTVFSNYPFLRELEVTQPSNLVPLLTVNSPFFPSPVTAAWGTQPTNIPLSAWMPMRVVFRGNAYEIRDNTGLTQVFNATGGLTNNPNCEINGLSGGGPCLGNIAETFEFRAVDRNLKAPYIQQWSFGFQWEMSKNLLWEVRYNGAKGTKLLLATALAQPFDLNDPNTPDYVFQRLNDAFVAGGGVLNAGATARDQGNGVAFGFNNPVTGLPDLNVGPNGQIIAFEARAPFLGLNSPEALILQSRGNSIYHALQTSLIKRFSRGLQFNLSYTYSRSIDDFSSDPGSTAGGGKPDVPNVGFQIQGDSRFPGLNRGVSDFDRPHRVSLSFVYELPTGGNNSRFLKGWQLSGFLQAQSGAPYSIFSSEPEARTAAQLNNLATGSGGLYRLAFGRPDLVGPLSDACALGTDDATQARVISALASPLGNFGNLPRNPCRANSQKRFDFAVSKSTRLSESSRLELRAEFFNLFNTVNFAAPDNDLVDLSGDFGKITRAIGGPRIIQFGARIVF
jgi:hypothetical protein